VVDANTPIKQNNVIIIVVVVGVQKVKSFTPVGDPSFLLIHAREKLTTVHALRDYLNSFNATDFSELSKSLIHRNSVEV